MLKRAVITGLGVVTQWNGVGHDQFVQFRRCFRRDPGREQRSPGDEERYDL